MTQPAPEPPSGPPHVLLDPRGHEQYAATLLAWLHDHAQEMSPEGVTSYATQAQAHAALALSLRFGPIERDPDAPF